MNKKIIKKLALISAGLMLTGTVTATTAQPVQATKWYVKHSPYFLTHKVKLTKNVTFKKFKFAKYSYEDYIVATKRLKKGSIIKVRKGGASYPWFVTGHGMRYTKHYGWTYLNEHSNWFTTKIKSKKVHKINKKTKVKSDSNSRFLNTPQYNKLVKKTFFKAEMDKGAALNIPNVGMLRLKGISTGVKQLELSGYFINASNKTIDVGQFLNDHFGFFDESVSKNLQFNLNKQCPPYADVHFTAIDTDIGAYDFENNIVRVVANANGKTFHGEIGIW